MPTVRELEQQIEKLEHFPVRITNTQTGRGVKSNAWINDLDYPYVNAASGSDTVSKWRRGRFEKNYPSKFTIVVKSKRSRGWTSVAGNKLLQTVRDGKRRRLRVAPRSRAAR